VPNLVGEKLDDARTMWRAAGFTGALTGGGTNENKKVLDQSQAAGTSIPCSSGITVSTEK
jgi:beta-lactam-binding protein with PASTA domain